MDTSIESWQYSDILSNLRISTHLPNHSMKTKFIRPGCFSIQCTDEDCLLQFSVILSITPSMTYHGNNNLMSKSSGIKTTTPTTTPTTPTTFRKEMMHYSFCPSPNCSLSKCHVLTSCQFPTCETLEKVDGTTYASTT